MNVLALSDSIAYAIATVLTIAALLHFLAVRLVRPLRDRWRFPPEFHHVGAIVELIAAAFLFLPATRLWGIMLAAIVFFVAGVSLLKTRHYVLASTNALLLIALIPASVGALF